MTNQEIIEKVKILLAPEEPDETVLNLQIEILKQKILNYCNRTDIPEALGLILVDIASKNYQASKTSGKALESVKRGDTELRYSESTTTSILDDYWGLIKPFVLDGGAAKVKFI